MSRRTRPRVEQSNVRVIKDEPPVVVTKHEQEQEMLARCYVAMAEVDYDLRMWRHETPDAGRWA